MEKFLVHQESQGTFELPTCGLEVAAEWVTLLGKKHEGVATKHAFLQDRGDSGVFLVVYQTPTYYNGLPYQVGEEVKLEHNGVLVFGSPAKGAVFVYKDLVQQSRRIDTQRINMMRFDLTFAKGQSDKLSRDFFRKAPVDLIEFSDYLLKFLSDTYSVERGGIYRVDGRRLVPVRARALSAHFRPSHSVIEQATKTKEPFRFSIHEMEGEASRSIVEGKIQSALCFPLVQGDRLVGLLYLDSQEEVLTQDVLSTLCDLMPGVTGYFNLLLHQEEGRLRAEESLGNLVRSTTMHSIDIFFPKASFSSFGFTFGVSDIFSHVGIKQSSQDTTLALVCCGQLLQFLGNSGTLLQVQADVETLWAVVDGVKEIERVFPGVQISFALVTAKEGRVRFAGHNTRIVVKPPDRNAFVAESEDVPFVDGAKNVRVLPLDYPLTPGMLGVIQGGDPAKVCGLLDRIKNIERIRAEVRGARGTFFRVKEQS